MKTLNLSSNVTPQQLDQIAPQMLRVILSADPNGGGFVLPIDNLTWRITPDQITGEISSGKALFGYTITRSGGDWVRDIRVLTGVDDGGAFAADEGGETFELLLQSLEFAAPPRQKNCKIGKPCKGECIAQDRTCRMALSDNALKAGNAAAESQPKGARGVGSSPDSAAQPQPKDAENPKQASVKPEQKSIARGNSPDLSPDTVIGFSPLTTEWLDKSLRDLEDGDNRENLAKMRQFMEINKTQVLVYDGKYRELERFRSAKEREADYLDLSKKLYEKGMMLPGEEADYLAPSEAAGHTQYSANFVVIQGGGLLSKARAIDSSRLKGAVESSINLAVDPKKRNFTLGFSPQLIREEDNLLTVLHELGHQIHFDARPSTKLDRPPREAKRLSRYSSTNNLEYAAEHFVAWAVAPKAFKTADPVGYDWITQMVENSLKKRTYG